MLTRIAVPILLFLFLLACLSAPVQAGDDKRMERLEIAMKVEAKAPAETVKALPAPPDSEAVTLSVLPDEPSGTLGMIYQCEEGDPLYLSTATPAVIQNFYADEMAKLGYSGNLMVDEEGNPIAPAFTYGCDLGAIRIVAAADAVPEKTLVAVIIVAP